MFPRFTQPDQSFVWPMRPEHVPACVRLHEQAFARGWAADEFESLLRDRTVIAHVATDGSGRILHGFALSRCVLDEGELLTIAVEPALRGHGRGRQILQAHLAALSSAGVSTLFLEVEEANAPARALYVRAGFEEIGRREGYYTLADGSRASALVLRRRS